LVAQHPTKIQDIHGRHVSVSTIPGCANNLTCWTKNHNWISVLLHRLKNIRSKSWLRGQKLIQSAQSSFNKVTSARLLRRTTILRGMGRFLKGSSSGKLNNKPVFEL